MSDRPNILFLMSDEHRADVAGFAGDEVVRTPALDELARTGVVFRNAYTPSPICVPGRQCLASGQLPKTCGCEGWVDLQPGSLTWARHFARHAYETVCCGKLHHQGWDQMQGWTARPAGDLRVATPYIDGKVERELRRATAAYYGMVDSIDAHYGRVLEQLRYVGQDLDDWIVIYTSDHGEMLGEHGIWEKQKFYEGSCRVPLIVRWPAGFAGGRVVDANVNLCDLFATLCDLTGLPVPEGLDSRSLAPLLRGDAVDWDDETVSQFGRHNLMIKRGALKYQSYGPEMPEVLFDLARDPRERQDEIENPAYAEAVSAFRARRTELGHGPDADGGYVNAGYGRA